MLKEPLRGIIVFSVIEALGWVTIVALAASAITGQPLLSVLFSALSAKVLAAGTGYGILEHVVAFNVGQDRPYLAMPKRKEK